MQLQKMNLWIQTPGLLCLHHDCKNIHIKFSKKLCSLYQ